MHFYFLSTTRAPPSPHGYVSRGIRGERGVLAEFGFPNTTAADICATCAKIKRRGGSEKCPEENVHLEDPRRAQANNRRGVLREELRRSRGGFNYKRAPDVCLPFYRLVFTAAPPRGLAPAAHAYRTYDRCIRGVYLYVYTYRMRKRVNIARNEDVDGKTPKIAYFSCNGDFPRVQVAVHVNTYTKRAKENFLIGTDDDDGILYTLRSCCLRFKKANRRVINWKSAWRRRKRNAALADLWCLRETTKPRDRVNARGREWLKTPSSHYTFLLLSTVTGVRNFR